MEEPKCANLRIPYNIQQRNNVGSTSQILQDLDLSLDLLLLNGLQNLDDAFLVIDDVNAFENFGVLAPAYPTADIVSSCSTVSRPPETQFLRRIQRRQSECGMSTVELPTNLAHDFVVFQNSPACLRGQSSNNNKSPRSTPQQDIGRLTDVNTIVVPVASGHVLVDIRIDPRHFAGRAGVAQERHVRVEIRVRSRSR